MMHALLAAVVATTGWTTPQVLSNGSIALGPELAIAPSGAAIAVWDHESGPDCAQSPASLTCAHIVEFSERPSPLGWSYPRELARPGIGARPEAALNDAGRAAVIWVHDIGRDRVVQATYRTGTNDSFPNPSDLSAAVLEVREHHVGLDAAGNAVVVWRERHGDDFDIAAEVRQVTAGGWAAPVVLSRGSPFWGPALAVTPAGEAFVAWIEDSSFFVVRGDLTNGSWDQPVRLSTNAGVGGAVALDGAGQAVAVWTLGDRPGIGAAARPAAGSWGAPVIVSDVSPFNGVTAPDVRVARNGTAVAVWVGGDLLRSSVRSRDGNWSRPVEVGAADAAEPRVAIDSRGDAVVAWLHRQRLLASLRPAVAAAWQPPEQLAGPEASAPRVALDEPGNGFALWNLRDGDSLPIMTAGFAATAWTPTLTNARRPSIRGHATVGRTVTCNRGGWTGTVPIGYAYSWLRNRSVRASGQRYRIRAGDVGARLECRVTAINAAGKVVANSPSLRVR
jgi:hypothetical protein